MLIPVRAMRFAEYKIPFYKTPTVLSQILQFHVFQVLAQSTLFSKKKKKLNSTEIIYDVLSHSRGRLANILLSFDLAKRTNLVFTAT